MNLFVFILNKAIKPTVMITAGLLCASMVFMSVSYHNSFAAAENYDNILSSFSNAEEGFIISKAQSTALSDNTREIYSRADKYISSHKHNGVPAPLPDSMVDEIIAARSESTSYNSVYTLMSSQLFSQAVSRKLITERTEGYSRNIRRGVTDEFSLRTAEKMTDDYTEVLINEENADKVYDTRAADNFTDFMSSELISYLGIFMLTFPLFSSELQSRRFAAIKATATGPKKFTAARAFVGLLQSAAFFTLWYFSLAAAAVISSGGGILSMPVQYLKGYELSHLPLSFGGFIMYMYALKLIHLLALCAASMLLSLLSAKVILSALASGLTAVLFRAAGRIGGAAGQILSCDISKMSRDINFIDLSSTPMQIPVVFCAVMILFALACLLLTVLLSERRRAYV